MEVFSTDHCDLVQVTRGKKNTRTKNTRTKAYMFAAAIAAVARNNLASVDVAFVVYALRWLCRRMMIVQTYDCAGI